MSSKIQEIINSIEHLNRDLQAEYIQMAEKYGFFTENKEIIFEQEAKKLHRLARVPLYKYIFARNFRHILSIPFVYMMVVPAIILDIFLTIYQAITFPLYRIPKVSRRDFINYDRRFLGYLNILQKIHCLYCSYVNGLFGYAVEIAARTERYWCPIKAASKPKFYHDWYQSFADYGNVEEWNEKFNHFEK